MIIVASSSGETMETKVDPRFGRSRYFMIVKVHDKEITHHKAVENIGGKQMHG
ncbi:diguanylate cyclase, partial [Candidatus Woesearchaeota archaeon]|nr:diguanylate cyclase [Candidatus Woesearchaeota archaeon]